MPAQCNQIPKNMRKSMPTRTALLALFRRVFYRKWTVHVVYSGDEHVGGPNEAFFVFFAPHARRLTLDA